MIETTLGKVVVVAVAITVIVGGGSFAISRYVIASAQEDGKGLAQERAIERSARKEEERQQKAVLERQTRLTGLLKTIEDSLQTRPLDSMLVISAANISFDLEIFDKAVRYYEVFLEKIEPSNNAVRSDYAYAMFKMGRTKEGIQVLMNIVRQEPKNQSALFNIAAMYAQLGEVSEASRWFKACEAVDPQSVVGKRAALAIKQLESTG